MPKPTTTSISDYEYIAPDDDYYQSIFFLTAEYSIKANFYLQAPTIIVNLFHLIVLFQKELRSSSVYILMIGICISDIISTSINFYSKAGELGYVPMIFTGTSGYSCIRSDYMGVNLGEELVTTASQISRRLFSWLAVVMAIIRLISVMFPMSERVDTLTSPQGSVITLIICATFWTLYSTWKFTFYRVFWLPDNAVERFVSEQFAQFRKVTISKVTRT